MHREGVSHSYPQPTTGLVRGHATSSAFSASAHPHEDWTKISDLAERRRIQNRIAQRNYRKKLKKRLEDLEKRANSRSASPEQKLVFLPKQKPSKKQESSDSKSTSSLETSQSLPEYTQSGFTAEPAQVGFLSLSEDRVFSEPFSRQISCSPPLAATYPMISADMFAYSTFSNQSSYASSCNDASIYAYQTPFASPFESPLANVEFPVKHELFSEPDPLAFNIGFPAMSSMDFSQSLAFADSLPQTPPLSDCLGLNYPPSPPESITYPDTPVTFPPSP